MIESSDVRLPVLARRHIQACYSSIFFFMQRALDMIFSLPRMHRWNWQVGGILKATVRHAVILLKRRSERILHYAQVHGKPKLPAESSNSVSGLNQLGLKRVPFRLQGPRHPCRQQYLLNLFPRYTCEEKNPEQPLGKIVPYRSGFIQVPEYTCGDAPLKEDSS